MEYNNGMGIEIPVWVIQSKNGKRVLNRKTNKFQSEITEDCTFSTPEQANEKLKMMDYGYVIKSKRHYRDLNNNRIW